MSDIRPTPAPLPLASRETAPFYVMIWPFKHLFEEKKATVYVKEGNFFRSQGGLTEEWGAHWTGIEATSLNDARLKAHASEGTACPRWHLEDQQNSEEVSCAINPRSAIQSTTRSIGWRRERKSACRVP